MLVYITSKYYPADTADKIYSRELARSFSKNLKDDFLFIIGNDFSEELEGINRVNLGLKIKRFKSPLYFFWTLYFIFSLRGKNPIFFSNDSYLLLILIFWRRVFGFDYKICSDWHMLSNDWRDAFIAKNSDWLVATSQKLKKIILNRSNIDESNVLVAYGGVDLEKYASIDKSRAREILNLPADKKLIAYIGFFKTMGMEKGLKTMIEALLAMNQGRMMLFVGGTDKEIEEYKNFAKPLGVLERCIFIGRKSFDNLILYQQAADILVIPYPDKPHFRDYGFPMKVYEYMASGRPIIYSKLELIEEVIGDCAFSFIPDDARDFVRVTEYVISNPKEGEGRAHSASMKVREYTWDKKAEKIANFIRN
jgi:glycosyltransferase involved in cell wall biosynthesis